MTTQESVVRERVRGVLHDAVSLAKPVADLKDESNLFDIGLSSFDLVTLLVALEEEFRVDFPDALMQRETFSCISNISASVERLQREQHVS